MSKRKNNKTVSVAFVALGCPKNTVDSEKMLAQIATSQMIITNNIEQADVAVINTCGFIESARAEAFAEIDNAVRIKKTGSLHKIVVAGCMAQMYGEKLLELAPDIDAVVGLAGRDEIAKIIKDIQKSKSASVVTSDDNKMVHDDSQRLLITGGHYAYLRISEGCSRRCAFCTIPDIRGPFRSKPMDMILKEAAELAASGVKELILIAQDTSNYGRDLGMKDGLVELLTQLEKIEGPQWIRVMYLYPANVTDALIEKIATSEKIVKYIDMPIQHINDDILKAMKRSDTKAKTTQAIEKLRKAIPDMIIRTTVITGFPGETDQQFSELLDFIKQVKFDALGCFAYSAEANTPAADMQDQIPEDVKSKRADVIMQTQQQIAFEKAKSQVGKTFDVIVDNVGEPGYASGRFFGQAPDIDSICLIENFTAQQGDIVKAKVIDTDNYDLIVTHQ